MSRKLYERWLEEQRHFLFHFFFVLFNPCTLPRVARTVTKWTPLPESKRKKKKITGRRISFKRCLRHPNCVRAPPSLPTRSCSNNCDVFSERHISYASFALFLGKTRGFFPPAVSALSKWHLLSPCFLDVLSSILFLVPLRFLSSCYLALSFPSRPLLHESPTPDVTAA